MLPTDEGKVGALIASIREEHRKFMFYWLLEILAGLTLALAVALGAAQAQQRPPYPFSFLDLSATDNLNRALSYGFIGTEPVFLAVAIYWLLRSRSAWATRVGGVVASYALALADMTGLFAYDYLIVQRDVPASFSQHMSPVDALYLSATTFTTVGAGGLYPVSEWARGLQAVQTATGLVLVVVALSLLVSRIRAPR